MDAVKFLKERSRMCLSHMKNGPCYSNKCPMYELRVKLSEEGPRKVICSSVLYKTPEEAVALVEKWSEDNPVKTRKMDLLEKYPNVECIEDGTPTVCAQKLGYCEECPTQSSCRNCWNTPMEA